MATQLKNTLAIAALAPGASVVLTHELDNGNIPVEPDIIFLPSPELAVLASDVTSITVMNQGAADFDGVVLVEYWHTFERAFGPQTDLNLSTKPYIVVGGENPGGAPQPPFEPFLTTRTIYARLAGSDVTGTGTLANPYRTFQRAIRDVPNFIPPGVRYAVDCTGIGIEVLPDDFVLPSWKSAQGISGYDLADTYFYIQTAVQFRADPQLVEALPAGAWNAVDPNGLISFTRAAGAWVPGALEGLFLVGSGGVFEKAVIWDNDATTIWITDGIPFTAPEQIMEPSVTLQAQTADPAGFGRAGIYASSEDSLAIAGFRIEPVAASGSQSLIAVGGEVYFELCDLIDFTLSDLIDCEISQSNVSNGLLGSRIFPFNSRFIGGGGFSVFGFSDGEIVIYLSVFDGCNPVGKPSPSPLTILGGLIINALSDGIVHVGTASITVEVTDSVGNAIVASGPTRLDLLGVIGTGNGGVGIRVLDGAQVSADADGVAGPTTVTGAGGDQEVGDLGAGAYPAAPFSLNDWTYDPTLGAAAQVTGTGARLFTP